MSTGYEVVAEFERELAAYCGAPYAVATDCCSNAIMLALAWWRRIYGAETIKVPRFTYPGVVIAALNAGHQVELVNGWTDQGYWRLSPTMVWDAARVLGQNMYDHPGALECLSFSVEKHLEIGKGGAILTDNPEARDWFIRARHDGRTPGDPNAPIQYPAWHCNMPPDYAARGLWLLSHLPDNPPPLEPTDYPDLAQVCAGIISASSSADSRRAVSDE